MKPLNEFLNESDDMNAKKLGIDKKTLVKMNKELKTKDYQSKGIFVQREFFITKSGEIRVRVNVLGRRVTPRDLFRLAIHHGYTGNTKYAEIDNGEDYVPDGKGKIHFVSDAGARGEGSITTIYPDDIDEYSEYEVQVEYYVIPREVYKINK